MSHFQPYSKQEVDDLYERVSLRVAKFRYGLLKVYGGVINVLVLLIEQLKQLIPAFAAAIAVRRVVAKKVEVLISRGTQEGCILHPSLGQ